MSLIKLGFWAASGAGGSSFYLSILGGADSEIFYSLALDSDGNLFSSGETRSDGAGAQDFLIVKHDSEGAVEWQRTLGNSDANVDGRIGLDYSNNVYLAGHTNTAGINEGVLAKYNSGGTIQWQKNIDGTNDDRLSAVNVDSSDNVYFAGLTVPATRSNALLTKYNSSGTLQWQRTLGGAENERWNSISFDSSDNVYVLGSSNTAGAGGNEILFAKYNTSGTLQWQRILGGTGTDSGAALEVSSSGNVYVCGNTNSEGLGSNEAILAKYNTSGTLQWQRILGGTGQDDARAIVIDSDENLYIAGNTASEGEGSWDYFWAKYNSLGTLQLQRTLGTSGFDFGAWAIKLDSSGALYMSGRVDAGAGAADAFIAKLPVDGSLTGTYTLDGVDFVYQASGLTSATSTLTAATSSLTAATSSLTSSAISLTDASSSLVQEIVNL
jgi:uncharacterized delta-60 repeat protein